MLYESSPNNFLLKLGLLLQEVPLVGVRQVAPRLGGEKHVLVHERET